MTNAQLSGGVLLNAMCNVALRAAEPWAAPPSAQPTQSALVAWDKRFAALNRRLASQDVTVPSWRLLFDGYLFDMHGDLFRRGARLAGSSPSAPAAKATTG